MEQWYCDLRRAVGLSTEPLAVRVKMGCATGEHDWNAKAHKAMMLFPWRLCSTAAITLVGPFARSIEMVRDGQQCRLCQRSEKAGCMHWTWSA